MGFSETLIAKARAILDDLTRLAACRVIAYD